MKNRLGTLPIVALLLLLALAIVIAWRSGGEPLPDPVVLAPSTDTARTTASANGSERNGIVPAPDALAAPVDKTAHGGEPARGFWVHGVVSARGGRPIEAADVAIALERDGAPREIAHARTAQDGRYAIEIAEVRALDPIARASVHLLATARASGLQPRTQRRPLARHAASATAAQGIAIDFELSAGRELSGRVVDAAGRPVGGARIALIVSAEQGRGPTRTVSAESESASDGRFTIGFVSSGRYELAVRAESIGTALSVLDLAAGDDRRVGDVALRGAGSVSGQCRYPDGKPAPYLELWAIPDTVADDGIAPIETVRRAPLEERDDGLFFGRTTSDAQGRFAFAGLRPGVYALRSPKPDVILEPRRGHYALGTAGIDLIVGSYRLIVGVRDTAGRPIVGATVGCTEMTVLSDGELEPGRARHATTSGPDGIACFEVEPDTTLALSANIAGGAEVEDLVILAHGQFELVQEFVISAASPPGRLRVVVRAPSGATIAPLDVALLSAATQRRIDQLGILATDAQGWLPPIPPGRYLLEVGTPVDERSFYFPVRSREVVEIESGASREVFLTARIGGRIEIALDLDGWVPDDFIAPEAALDPKARAARAEAHLRQHGATVRLIAQDKTSRSLQLLVPSVVVDGQIEIASRLLPGDRAPVEALIEPGTYTLEVDAAGFRHVALPVVVEAGRTIEVRVAMSAP